MLEFHIIFFSEGVCKLLKLPYAIMSVYKKHVCVWADLICVPHFLTALTNHLLPLM
jgi:hypothetical protein